MQEETKATLMPAEKGIVRPKDFTTVEWVKSDFHKAGTKSQVTKVLAEKLIADGKAIEATEDKGEPKKSKKSAE